MEQLRHEAMKILGSDAEILRSLECGAGLVEGDFALSREKGYSFYVQFCWGRVAILVLIFSIILFFRN